MSQPIDWPGLLKWSMAYHDGTAAPEDLQEISAEDKAFIMNAMDNMIVDEFKRIKILLNVIRIPEERSKLRKMTSLASEAAQAIEDRRKLQTVLQMRQAEVDRNANSTITEISDEQLDALVSRLHDEKIESLEELHDRILKIDNSVALIQFGGVASLLEALRSSDVEVKQSAAAIAAVVVQNNPFAQDAFCDSDTFLALIDCLSFVPTSPLSGATSLISERGISLTPRSKLGYSLVKSALFYLRAQIENHPKSAESFIECGGLAAVFKCLRSLEFDIQQLLDGETISDNSRSPIVAVVRAAFALFSVLLETTAVNFPRIDITKADSSLMKAVAAKDPFNTLSRFEKYVQYAIICPVRHRSKENESSKTVSTETETEKTEQKPQVILSPTKVESFSNALVEVETPEGSGDANTNTCHENICPKDKPVATQPAPAALSEQIVPVASIVREALATQLQFGTLFLMINFADSIGRSTAQKFARSYLLSGSPSSIASQSSNPSIKFRTSLGNKIVVTNDSSKRSVIQNSLRGSLAQRFQDMEAELKLDASLKEDLEDEMVLVATTVKILDDLVSGKKMTADELTKEISTLNL